MYYLECLFPPYDTQLRSLRKYFRSKNKQSQRERQTLRNKFAVLLDEPSSARRLTDRSFYSLIYAILKLYFGYIIVYMYIIIHIKYNYNLYSLIMFFFIYVTTMLEL